MKTSIDFHIKCNKRSTFREKEKKREREREREKVRDSFGILRERGDKKSVKKI